MPAEQTTLWSLIERRAAENPGGLALAGPTGRLTWEQLRDRATAIASLVHERGGRPGDYVCLVLPSSPGWVAAWLGLRRCGATCISIGDRATPHELRTLFRRFPPRLAITHTAALRAIAPVCDEAGVLLAAIEDAAPAGECPVADPDAPATIHLTSGSSGTSKGVPRTEAGLLEEGANVAEALGLTPAGRVLCATPVYHSFASGLALACLQSGAVCLLLDRLRPATLLDLARREDATLLAGVPYVFQTLTTLTAETGGLDSLRLAVSGGAPLRRELVSRFQERFGVPLVQEYGLSEAGIVSFDLHSMPGDAPTAGRAIPNVEIRIVDPEDASRSLPAGAEGEVLVRRRHAPVEYTGLPEESGATFTPYGVRTGDLGHLDQHGRLRLTGRIKSMINVAGAKVAPAEVEEALLSHPAVEEAAVFAAPDAERGEAVVAVVATRDSACVDEAALIAHCRSLLSPYKTPSRIHAASRLPRTPSGKPDLPRIRETFSQRRGEVDPARGRSL